MPWTACTFCFIIFQLWSVHQCATMRTMCESSEWMLWLLLCLVLFSFLFWELIVWFDPILLKLCHVLSGLCFPVFFKSGFSLSLSCLGPLQSPDCVQRFLVTVCEKPTYQCAWWEINWVSANADWFGWNKLWRGYLYIVFKAVHSARFYFFIYSLLFWWILFFCNNIEQISLE